MNVNLLFLIALLMLWAGALLAISFMEAWVKFRAPLLSREAGLDVGRRVFRGLYVIEGILGVGVVAFSLWEASTWPPLLASLLPPAILLFQILVLFPSLEKRALERIEGRGSSGPQVHRSYVFLEFIKLIALFAAAILWAQ
jgi:hypothetical protein